MAQGTSTQFGLIPAFILSAVVLFGGFCAFWYGLAGIAWLFHQTPPKDDLIVKAVQKFVSDITSRQNS